jgi:tetratricopeptide (TPR) repeat protein
MKLLSARRGVMAPTQDPYEKMLSLINEWFDHKVKFRSLTHQAEQRRNGVPPAIMQAIQAEDGRIAQLETSIEAIAGEVIQCPLTFDLDRLLSLASDQGVDTTPEEKAQHQAYLTELYETLDRHSNEDELNDICLRLGVAYDSLPAQSKKGKARELVMHCDRHVCIPELVEECKRLWPKVRWPEPLVDPFHKELRKAIRKMLRSRAEDPGEDCKRVCNSFGRNESPSPIGRAVLYLFCAQVFVRIKNSDEAETLTKCALDNILSTDHHMSVVAYLIQGNALAKRSDYARAIEAYRKAADQMGALYDDAEDKGTRKARAIKVLREDVEKRIANMAKAAGEAPLPVSDPCPAGSKEHPFACHRVKKRGTESSPIISAREHAESFPRARQRTVPSRLPIMRAIAAGEEKPTSDDVIGYIDVKKTDDSDFEFMLEGQLLKAKLLKGSQITFLPGYTYVVTQVLGDSMDKADIAPDDYVILRKSKPDSSGDIVAVVFYDEDDKAVLKRVYYNKSSAKVILKPESSNPKHKTRILQQEIFAGENPSVEIVGLALAVLKPQ